MSSLTQTNLSLSRRAFAPLPLGAVLRVFTRWQDERRTRAALARLDSHLLQDIGLERRLEETPPPRLYPGF